MIEVHLSYCQLHQVSNVLAEEAETLHLHLESKLIALPAARVVSQQFATSHVKKLEPTVSFARQGSSEALVLVEGEVLPVVSEDLAGNQADTEKDLQTSPCGV